MDARKQAALQRLRESILKLPQHQRKKAAQYVLCRLKGTIGSPRQENDSQRIRTTDTDKGRENY